MPSHKVSMKVCEKNMADVETERLCIREVLMDIALRINDNSGPTLFIAEQVGGMCETAEVVLFQNHGIGASLALT